MKSADLYICKERLEYVFRVKSWSNYQRPGPQFKKLFSIFDNQLKLG